MIAILGYYTKLRLTMQEKLRLHKPKNMIKINFQEKLNYILYK